MPVPDGVAALTSAAAEIRAQGLEIADIGLRRPTLDEAFLHLTGAGQAAAAQAGEQNAPKTLEETR